MTSNIIKDITQVSWLQCFLLNAYGQVSCTSDMLQKVLGRKYSPDTGSGVEFSCCYLNVFVLQIADLESGGNNKRWIS